MSSERLTFFDEGSGPTSRRCSGGVRGELVGDQSAPCATTGMRQRGEKEPEGGGVELTSCLDASR
jgi:hypothetical protein